MKKNKSPRVKVLYIDQNHPDCYSRKVVEENKETGWKRYADGTESMVHDGTLGGWVPGGIGARITNIPAARQ